MTAFGLCDVCRNCVSLLKEGTPVIYRKELPRLTADVTGKTSSKLGNWGRMLLKISELLKPATDSKRERDIVAQG